MAPRRTQAQRLGLSQEQEAGPPHESPRARRPERHARPRGIKWLCVGICVLALPLFLRATGTVTPDVALRPGATASAAPVATASLAPVATPEHVESPTPTEEAVPAFAVADMDAPTETPTEAPSPAPTETPEPDAWFYEDAGITVSIAKKEWGKFVYFLADIQLTRPEQFWYAFSNEKYGASTEPLSDIAQRHDPVLAINGDYYGFHSHGIILRGGELFRKSNSARQLLIVDKNGDLSVLTDRTEKQAIVANRLLEEGVLHTFEFGPVLVNKGERTKLRSEILRVEEGYREPRTAIGQLGPLHYLVIVVDGRSPGYSDGCDLPMLQDLFIENGVSIAFNLDGGGSTTLWFNGEVINKPSSGDERSVSDIVMFVR